MTSRRTPAMLAAVLLAGSTGCVSVHAPTFFKPAPQREWPATLAAAQRHVSQGRFAAADSALTGFAHRYPESPEAIETAYWRALFGMDPANPHASLPTAIQFLKAYLDGPRQHQHQREAAALRSLAVHLEELNKGAATLVAQPKETVATTRPSPGDVRIDVPKPVVDPAFNAESEIKRLKDELAKANAELERIRRRLAQPPPQKP